MVALVGVACVLGIQVASLVGVDFAVCEGSSGAFPSPGCYLGCNDTGDESTNTRLQAEGHLARGPSGLPNLGTTIGLCSLRIQLGRIFVLPLVFAGGMSSNDNGAGVGSAMILAFYTVAAAVLYSFLNSDRFDTTGAV